MEKEADQSTASKILSMVEDAAARRSRSESFVTSFARWYTPAVLGCALLVGTIPPLFLGNWSDWIYRALEFLVVSCPCALVISVPLAYFGGIGGASRKGILVKGSDALETLAKVNTMVFDKTGTLTQGVFQVSSVEGENREEILEIAALCEQFSNHPIARSLRDSYGKDLSEDRISEFEEVAGYGVSAKVDGIRYFVGNEGWMRKNGVEILSNPQVGTPVYLAKETQFLGSVMISDRIKPNAGQSLCDLQKIGVSRTVMLTGDGEASASLVANQVGISEYRANLLPGDKVSAFQEISDKSSVTAFVGDGMNDAPVLASADVGIAMGALGSDAAMETADIVLMNDDLSSLPKALLLARKTHRIVLQNMIFSIAVKVGVMVFCALGYATMWHAVFADVGVSVIAILNSMRTLSKS
ncbi:MAG: cadmium-translocating P-type ATPase [Clostridia bacterium]|nr:cadmium-translocating P-type ATPase [Clostridia bacterium]